MPSVVLNKPLIAYQFEEVKESRGLHPLSPTGTNREAQTRPDGSATVI
jgi:hypothetical protein